MKKVGWGGERNEEEREGEKKVKKQGQTDNTRVTNVRPTSHVEGCCTRDESVLLPWSSRRKPSSTLAFSTEYA